MTDTTRLKDRPAYKLGYQHEQDGTSDFYRRRLFGDERRAYMLGRLHSAIDRKVKKES